MAKPKWDKRFTPWYTPKQMLEMGVFEGKYINSLEGLPSSWYRLPKVLSEDDDPDPDLNYFGVKSRMSLSEWREKGWLTKDSPYGWFGWYCHYFLGRRLEDEDEWQIQRWYSFVARHQGQITNSGDLDKLDKRLKQRQALLQWGWESTRPFTEQNRKKALKRLSKHSEVSLESQHPSRFLQW